MTETLEPDPNDDADSTESARWSRVVDVSVPPPRRVIAKLEQAYRMASPQYPKHDACADLAGVTSAVARYAYETGWRDAGIPPISEVIALEAAERTAKLRGEVVESQEDVWADRVRAAADRSAEDLMEARAMTGKLTLTTMQGAAIAMSAGGKGIQLLQTRLTEISQDMAANPDKYTPKQVAYHARTCEHVFRTGVMAAKVADDMAREAVRDRKGDLGGGDLVPMGDDEAIEELRILDEIYNELKASGRVIDVEATESPGKQEDD